MQQLVELAQSRLGIGAFKIVVGAEQALASRLALAAGDGAERVETPRDRRQEALFAFDVGRDGTEHRRLLLVGAVRAPETLDCGIGPPAGLEQVMDALALVFGVEIRVIAAPGAAGVGEDEDALVVVHEGARFREIRGSRPRLDAEPLAAPDDAAAAAGDLGDGVMPKRCRTWSSARSFHSEVGISARRASLVETTCSTQAWPALRSRAIAAIRVGHFIAVSR